MAKIISITDKLTLDKPQIELNGKFYPVNDGMATVLKFEELQSEQTVDNMIKAIELTLGAEAAEELNLKTWSILNFRVLTIAILAAMQGLTYEEAANRFRKAELQ